MVKSENCSIWNLSYWLETNLLFEKDILFVEERSHSYVKVVSFDQRARTSDERTKYTERSVKREDRRNSPGGRPAKITFFPMSFPRDNLSFTRPLPLAPLLLPYFLRDTPAFPTFIVPTNINNFWCSKMYLAPVKRKIILELKATWK